MSEERLGRLYSMPPRCGRVLSEYRCDEQTPPLIQNIVVGGVEASATSGFRHSILPPISSAKWLRTISKASSQPANTRWHSLISDRDRRNIPRGGAGEKKPRRDPNRHSSFLISSFLFFFFRLLFLFCVLFFLYLTSDHKPRQESGPQALKKTRSFWGLLILFLFYWDENGLKKDSSSLEHHQAPSFIHYLDNLWLWLTAGVAKSHETRQFSYMHVVDGSIVTFSFFGGGGTSRFFLFWGGDDNEEDIFLQKKSSRCLCSAWTVLENRRIHERGNLTTKSLSYRTGILNIRHVQEFIGAQPDGAEGRSAISNTHLYNIQHYRRASALAASSQSAAAAV